jgi:uncharacterized Zn-binding protein involved in type VI secretion
MPDGADWRIARRASHRRLYLCPSDMIAKGSATVTIGGLPAARQFDQTAHGGVVVSGCPVVLIGG